MISTTAPRVIYLYLINASTTRQSKLCTTPPASTSLPYHIRSHSTPTLPSPLLPTPPRSSFSPPSNIPTVKHSHFTFPPHPPSSRSRKHIPRTSDSNTQPSLSMALLRVSTSPMALDYTNYHPRLSSRTLLNKFSPHLGRGHHSRYKLSACHNTSPPFAGARALCVLTQPCRSSAYPHTVHHMPGATPPLTFTSSGSPPLHQPKLRRTSLVPSFSETSGLRS